MKFAVSIRKTRCHIVWWNLMWDFIFATLLLSGQRGRNPQFFIALMIKSRLSQNMLFVFLGIQLTCTLRTIYICCNPMIQPDRGKKLHTVFTYFKHSMKYVLHRLLNFLYFIWSFAHFSFPFVAVSSSVYISTNTRAKWIHVHSIHHG